VRVGPIHALLPLFVVRVWPEVKAANHSDLASDMQVDLASNTSEPDEEMSMRIDGACHCGYITIEGEADPEKTSVCHCTDCQKGTGSAFRVNVPVSGATFRISGQPTSYLKTTAESGTPRLQAFCPRCGSPIYSTTPGEGAQPFYMVRVGILRQRGQFAPRRQNWFRSSLPWVTGLAALHKNEKQG
jgi:hypothetical protein